MFFMVNYIENSWEKIKNRINMKKNYLKKLNMKKNDLKKLNKRKGI